MVFYKLGIEKHFKACMFRKHQHKEYMFIQLSRVEQHMMYNSFQVYCIQHIPTYIVHNLHQIDISHFRKTYMFHQLYTSCKIKGIYHKFQ